MKPPLIQALEQAVDNAAAEGLTFPMVQVMVSSSRAVVWAIEISEGPDGIHHRDLCHNLSGDPLGIGMATPIILYFSDRNGQTFQAGILSDPGGAQA